MKILRILKKNHGVSLVEVLAVIVILSIVGILLFSVISSGQKQYSIQGSKNQELKDISYALKVITKELRQNHNIIVVDNTITINNIKYKQKNNSIIREDLNTSSEIILIDNITNFEVKGTSSYVEIAIDNISTNIAIRS